MKHTNWILGFVYVKIVDADYRGLGNYLTKLGIWSHIVVEFIVNLSEI